MKKEMDRIIIESREEISLLQNALEIAIASGKCNEDEEEVAREASQLLESMWYAW